MFHIKKELNKRLKKLNISGQVRAAGLLERYNQIIQDEFGQIMKNKVKASYFKNQYLYITINSSVVGNELRLREDQVLNILKNENYNVKGLIYIT
jgi:hypothetical protein